MLNCAVLTESLHHCLQQGAIRVNREVVPMCRVRVEHRISSRRHKDSAEHLLRANTETQQQPAAAAAAPNPGWNEYPGLSELQCPRCLSKFNDMDAAEYLNHFEECAKL